MSLFKSPEAEAAYRSAYDNSLRLWPAEHERFDIATGFGSTHVIACGPADGKPVLLLHAMGFSATMWYATVSGLSGEFRCYAADFPSDMGLSAMTCPPASLADCAAWLSALLDCLGIVRSVLVGASYGSFLALNYAIAEPARVSKVLLTSPAAGFVALRKSFYLKLFLSILTFLLPGRSAPEKMMRWIFEDRLPLDHPVIRQMMVGIRSLNSRIRVYPRVFGDSELAKMQAPLYLLLGEKEVCYNPQSAAQRARRTVGNASVEIVPNAGHMLVMERPEIVNPGIAAFLRD
jgi:pimeloyl-ACP methyl ester carboxylesterase